VLHPLPAKKENNLIKIAREMSFLFTFEVESWKILFYCVSVTSNVMYSTYISSFNDVFFQSFLLFLHYSVRDTLLTLFCEIPSQDNPFWEKINPSRERKKREKSDSGQLVPCSACKPLGPILRNMISQGYIAPS
jgi:hypothetical protein